MSDSGHRPILPGPRTISAEMVLFPKRVLVEIYSLILEQDEAIQKLTESRVDIHATKRKLEELLNQHVPGLVLEIMLQRRDTPTATLEATEEADPQRPPRRR